MSPDAVVVRSMQLADRAAVTRLAEATRELQDVARDYHYYEDEPLARMIESERIVTLVAELEGKLAGFMTAFGRPEVGEAYLEDLAVSAWAQGQGVGRALIAACLRQLAAGGMTRYWLLVHEGNQRMRTIMEHYGFEAGRQFRFMSGEWANVLPRIDKGQSAQV